MSPGRSPWDLTRPETLEALRRRFGEAEPALAAFLPEPDRWRRLAVELAAVGRDRSAAGPLHGAPFGVKDVFHVDGLPTFAGTRLSPAELAGDEAVAVRRLRGAGGVVLGKTVCTELAYFAPGPTRNPHDPDHTPGGSSSGSAAAVAAGLCPLALGTQTIGSISRPASFCGIVGFKPSHERVPRDGVVPLAASLDHVGVLAADVAWATAAAAVLCDGWRPEAAAGAGGGFGEPGRPLRLLVPTGPYLGALEANGEAVFSAACERLVAAGHVVERVAAMADFAAVSARHRLLVAADAAAAHGRLLERFADLLAPRTRELLAAGREVAPADAEAARRGRLELRTELTAELDRRGADLWLSPAATGPAPRGLASTGDPVMNLPWTHAGLPTVALPAGLVAGRLPVGVQLAGRFGEDEELLAAAAVLAEPLAVSPGPPPPPGAPGPEVLPV